MGYDDSFSKDEIDELKKFIDDSGVLGLERAFGDSEALSVNESMVSLTLPLVEQKQPSYLIAI